MKFRLVAGLMVALFLVSMLGAVMSVSAGSYVGPEDVNGDGTVTITDVTIVAKAFGSSEDKPNIVGEPYNPAADINTDGKINIVDLVRVATHLGEDP